MSDETPAHDQKTTNQFLAQRASPEFEVAPKTQPMSPVLTIGMAVSHTIGLARAKVSAVQGIVRGNRFHQKEIFGSVVGLDAVAVVDQASDGNQPVALLPNPAMLEDSLAARQRQSHIAHRRDRAMPVALAVGRGLVGMKA